MIRFDRMNARLFARFAGSVTLSRVTGEELIDPSQPWLGTTTTTTTESVAFIVTEAESEWIARELIQVGDLIGLMAIPATPALNPPKQGDRITAGSRDYIILRVSPIHSDPDAVLHYHIQGRL